jgi:glycosyltransferase involved in cell wall biosynthesis
MVTISLITATYNRRELLKKLFDSLVAQQYPAIEWLIVDDGGTDHTEDAVAEFRRQASFPIRYLRLDNGGKPRAVNRGLEMATGDVVCVVDDDDFFLPDVFRTVARDFAEIADRDDVAGLSYLTADPAGRIWGRPFPRDGMVSDHFECRINRKIWGDKCEFTKADLIHRHGFRYYEGRKRGGMGGDALFHFAIAEMYRTCYRNAIVLIKDYQADGISVNWRRKALQNADRTAEYYAAHLNRRVRFPIRLRYMIAYVAILWYARRRIPWTTISARKMNLLFYLACLPGILLGARWRRYDRGPAPVTGKWLRSHQ